MGTATSQGPCGCCLTRLLEPDEDVWIEWIKCAEHWVPEDNARMIEAAKNRRELEKCERARTT